MILVFYACNALNVLVKLLAIKLIRDARNRKYHACCPKKLHKDSENLSKQSTELLMRGRWDSSEFLSVGREIFSNFLGSLPTNAISSRQREAKANHPDDRYDKRPDVRQ